MERIRKIIIKSYIVYFYENDENHKLYVLAVLYGKQDQLKQLNDLDL